MTGTQLDKPVLSQHARELILVEALQAHSSLFSHADPWQLAASLLALFDELILYGTRIDDSEQAFIARLNQAYGEPDTDLLPLSREAKLVYTLWHAWQEQIDAEDKLDPQMVYHDALQHDPATNDGSFIFLTGYEQLLPAEIDWVNRNIQANRIEILLHGQVQHKGYHPDAPLTALLDTLVTPHHAATVADSAYTQTLQQVYNWQQQPLNQRAAQLAAQHDSSPLQQHLSVFTAPDAESHVQGVDIQIRQWLLEGKQRIGIVTEDRRLARRLRAVLERAGILLQDSGGWALSTTSAAAVLERWFETLEEDFAHQPLMDVLKSPFLFKGTAREHHLYAVYRLEQDIILHANIARDLQRFRHQVELRARLLPEWADESAAAVHELLDTLASAAEPLSSLIQTRSAEPDSYFAALEESLSRLGILETLQIDAAGQRILQELAGLRASLQGRSIKLSWRDWRTWCGRALETQNFRPGNTASDQVQLLNMDQSRLLQFDALIIASVDREHFPGHDQASPFFNNTVRAELGLRTWRDTQIQRFHHFRRLLEAAPQILLTLQGEQQGELQLPSPWLQTLQVFHQLAYGNDLSNVELRALVNEPEAHIEPQDRFPYTGVASMAAPRAPQTLLPQTLSASRHQRLIDCPYRFFAADCLGLQAAEEISEVLRQKDYGQRIHLALQAFHGDTRRLPGPFTRPFNKEHRSEAIALLLDISDAVFAEDVEQNYQHRGLQQRWTALIPKYVDWQIQRSTEWRVKDTELVVNKELADKLQIKGRIDRVDQHGTQHAIIDYKTGSIPKKADILAGEAVQLTSYALMLDNTQRVEYVQLSNDVKSVGAVESEDLHSLTKAIQERLIEMKSQLETEIPLPAWGDAETCTYCEMKGVCRKEAWGKL